MRIEYSKRAIADLRQIAVYYTGPAIRSLLQESQPAFKRSSLEWQYRR